MKHIFISIITFFLITSCTSSSTDKSQSNNIDYIDSVKSESIDSKNDVENDEPLEYKVEKLELTGNGKIDGVIIPKFTGIIRISKDYSAEQMRKIAEEAAYSKPEISIDNSILMIEFYKTGDPLEGLNYGFVNRTKGVWNCTKNETYQMVKEKEEKDKEIEKKYANVWKERSEELANGGTILGVFKNDASNYSLMLKKDNKYYIVEFEVNSSKAYTDELVSIANNKFKYKDPQDYTLAIEGDKLNVYYPDDLNPGKLFLFESYDRAK